MIETICRDCGQRYQVGTDHVCPKKPAAKKSTAALKEVPVASHVMEETPESRKGVAAGTQAPPVDTFEKHKSMLAFAEVIDDTRVPLPVKRGRPKTIPDMRAYKAQKERERRQRLKEGK